MDGATGVPGIPFSLACGPGEASNHQADGPPVVTARHEGCVS